MGETVVSVSPDDLHRMRDLARNASTRAYAPYSAFAVGAAVRCAGGEIVTGANVECASYSLTICAERNAIFQAVASGHRVIDTVVIYTPTAEPCLPCGACLQVISEFGSGAAVYSFCAGERHIATSLQELLPHAFGPASLAGDE